MNKAVAPARALTPGAAGILRTPGGGEVYFEDTGGDGPVLFYIYGLACSIAHWKYQLAYFAQREGPDGAPRPHYRQIWMDFRGHGRSPAIATGVACGINEVVSDVVAVCKERGVREAHFLGQSMGGTIALQLARDYPELTLSLVLLASPARDPGDSLPMQPFSGILWRALGRLHDLSVALPKPVKYGVTLNTLLFQQPFAFNAFREMIRLKGFNPSLAQTDDITEYVRNFFAVDPLLFSAMASELRGFDAVKFAHLVTCPVLLINGANDQVIPLAEARRLQRYLPRARLEVVPHGSHCPHFDDPSLVNRLISDFLADVAAR